MAAVARKPVQSFDAGPTDAGPANAGPTDDGDADVGPSDADQERWTTDAHVLAAAGHESPEAVCPPQRWYPLAMAPPMAAAALDSAPFTVADLVAETLWPPGTEVGLVETAGGVRSPVAADGDSRALVAGLGPDLVVLVADASLGAINSVRLAMDALPDDRAAVVFLNRFEVEDRLHGRNRSWLQDDGYQVITAPDELLALLTPW